MFVFAGLMPPAFFYLFIMIQRKNNIRLDADEISFTVSFSAVDVWSWLHHMAWLMHRDNPEFFDFSLNLPKSKEDIIHFIINSPNHGLGWMPEKRALPIAEWAFATAIRKKYLLIAGEKDGRTMYNFASMLVRKHGRPKKEDWA